MSLDQTRLAALAATVAEQGYVIIPDFLDAAEAAGLLASARARAAADEFRPATVGRGDSNQLRQDVRGDEIRWLEPATALSAEQPFWLAIEALRREVNAATLLGLFDFEGHFARYPAGSFYRKHRDAFRGSDGRPGMRVVSAVCYLNPDWTPADGGQLRIYLGEDGAGETIDVEPRAGTLVVFLSDRYWHEVLPATRERWSLTGWFRRRADAF